MITTQVIYSSDSSHAQIPYLYSNEKKLFFSNDTCEVTRWNVMIREVSMML